MRKSQLKDSGFLHGAKDNKRKTTEEELCFPFSVESSKIIKSRSKKHSIRIIDVEESYRCEDVKQHNI